MSLTMDSDVIHTDPRTGDAVDTGTISMTGVPPGTEIAIEVEMDNEWDATVSPDTVSYIRGQASASIDISVRVRAPIDELAFIEGVLMVTATAISLAPVDKAVNAAVRVVTGQVHDLDVKWRMSTVECCQNDTFEIKGTLTNNGNGDETVAFVIERPFPGVAFIVDYADVPVGETTNFSITVEVPHNLSLGSHHLKVHCFILVFLGMNIRQVSAHEIDLEVIEDEGTGGGWVLVGIVGLICALGVAFYILRRERVRREERVDPHDDLGCSHRASVLSSQKGGVNTCDTSKQKINNPHAKWLRGT